MDIRIETINIKSPVSLEVMDGKKKTVGVFQSLELFRASGEGIMVFGKTFEDACEFFRLASLSL